MLRSKTNGYKMRFNSENVNFYSIHGIMDYRKAINFNPTEGTDRSACECFKTTGKLSDRLDMKFVISVLEIKANKLNNCNK